MGYGAQKRRWYCPPKWSFRRSTISFLSLFPDEKETALMRKRVFFILSNLALSPSFSVAKEIRLSDRGARNLQKTVSSNGFTNVGRVKKG